MRSKLSWAITLGVLWLAACAGDDNRGTSEDDAEVDGFALQAEKGAALYAKHCAACHGESGEGSAEAPRVVGLEEGALPEKPPASRRVRDVDFVTVADVAGFAVESMPPGKGGSLSNADYLAILAFDLQANGITLEEELSLELAADLTIPR